MKPEIPVLNIFTSINQTYQIFLNRTYLSFFMFQTKNTDNFFRLKPNIPNKLNIPTISFVENQA